MRSGAARGVKPLFLCLGLTAALASAGLRPTLAQDPAAPAAGRDAPSIVDVRVEGNRRITAAGFFRLTTLRTGQPFDPEVIRRQYRVIWDSGLFDDLWVESLDAPAGKVVVFHVEERPVVVTVDYGKSPVVSLTAIEDRLRERDLQVQLNQPLNRERLRTVEAEIVRLHEEKGFLGTEVSAEVTDRGDQTQAVVFQIRAGAKTLIKKIEFVGNTKFSDRQLKDTMTETIETGLKGIFSKKDLYHPIRFNADLEQVRRAYYAKGHLDLILKPPVVEFVSKEKAPKPPPAPPEPLAVKPGETPEQTRKRLDKDAKRLAAYEKKMAKRKPPKRKAIITVDVEEGPEYKVGAVSVTGATIFPEGSLRSLIPLREGQTFNSDALQRGLDSIEALYGQRGYFYATTNRDIQRQSEGGYIADVTVNVSEGEQYSLNRVEFTGNTSTRDRVLRRELPLAEGEIFNTRLWGIGLTRINQLGYWALTQEPAITPEEGEPSLNARITGAEQGRNEIQVGGGFSGVEGAFFQGSYATRNFLGRGAILQASLQIGGRSELVNISYTEPYFLGSRNTVGGSIFRRELQYTDFTRSAQGFTLLFGQRLGNFSSWATTYRLEKFDEVGGSIFYLDITNLPPGFEDIDVGDLFNRQFGTALAAINDTVNSSIIPVFTYNTVNNPFRPTKGHRLRLSVEFTGGFLGGDNEFLKPILDYTWYRPLWSKTHFAFHAEGGIIRSVNNALIPRSERFFLGGDIRGPRVFQTRSLAPIGPVAGIPPIIDDEGNIVGIPFSDVGGDSFVLFQSEYVVRVTEPLDFALFFDAGNAFGEITGFDIGELRYSAGVEARFYLPIFQAPLRLIYGRVLDEEPFDQINSFQFSIGFPF